MLPYVICNRKTQYVKDLNPVQINLYILRNPNQNFNVPSPTAPPNLPWKLDGLILKFNWKNIFGGIAKKFLEKNNEAGLTLPV